MMVEDAPADAELIQHELRKANIQFISKCVDTKRAFLKELKERWPDVIISDFTLPQFDALEALRLLSSGSMAIPFILVTGSTSEEVAVECIKQGADDYILKSSLKRLPTAVLGSVAKKRALREREKAEAQVLEQAALLDKAQDAILLLDLEGRARFWNKSAERLYGWTAAEVGGQPLGPLLHAADDTRFEEARRSALREGEWHGELCEVDKEKRPLTVESRWSLVRDAEGQPKSLLIINSDITEKKKLEAHFMRAQRMESIGTLAGGIAHDLNNVLTPILMSIKLLRDELGDGSGQELLDTLESSAHRGAGIVQQVLSFARGVEGERAIFQPKHPLNEVIKIAKDIFPPLIHIRSKIAKDLWPVYGDPTQVHQVFMNLFVNARDAMPHGGRLQVDAENTVVDESYSRMQADAKAGPYVVISISDSGTGIAPGVLPKIFEPFFTTKEVGKGTGLGLSTAMAIVKSHGGFFNVYSEMGKGTSFKVHLPAASDQALVQARSAPARKLPLGHGELILVVDDELAIREIIKVTLENHGFRVLTANDGTEAVAVFAENKREIQAVVVDIMMPYMDGPATMRALQKFGSAVKFVAISGLMENEKFAEMSDLGLVSFLGKPFTTEQLLVTLNKVLPAPKKNGEETATAKRPVGELV